MASAIDATKPISGSTPGPTTASVRNNFAIAASEISAMQAPADGTSYAQQDSGVTNFPTFLNLILKHNSLPPPLPTPPHVPTDMRIAPADGTPAALLMDSWGTTGTNTSILSFRHAGGTASSPGQSVLNAGLGRIEMIGHDTAAYGGSGATITAFAGEGWTPVAHGTYVNFATMGIGQTGGTVRMQIGATGGIVIGTPSGSGPIAGGIGSDMGPGTINVSGGVFVNGGAVGGGPGGGMSGPIIFSSPLTGGTITSSGTVGLATPAAQLLGGTGTGFAAVSVGTGLNLSGGSLTATGTPLTIPNAGLIGGNGAALGGITVGTGLNLAGAFGSQTLTATGASLTIPNANIVSGNGSALGSINVSTGLLLSGAFPNQTLTATGSGSGITQLTGDILAGPGTGSVVATLPNVNLTAGTYTNATVTVNLKGQVLSAASGSGSSGPTTLTGDVTGTGTGTVATTVVQLQTRHVATTPPTDTQVLGWNAAANGGLGQWEPKAPVIGTSSGTVNNSATNLMAWYASAGTAVSGLSTITAQAVGSLSINQSPNPAPALFLPGTLLQLVGNDGAGQPNIELTGFAGSPGLVGRRAAGTSGSLANTTSGASLLALTARGWDSTNLWMPGSTTGANMVFQTAEGWTAAAHGTNISFSTTPIGQLVSGPQVVIGPASGVAGSTGGLTVGAATAPTVGGPLVTGDLNVAGRILQNGSPYTTVGGGADTISAAVTAATGPQGTVLLTSQFNVVTFCPVGGGVTLRAIPAGDHCIVRNSGLNPLTIFPATGVQINGGGVNTAHVNTLLPNSTIYFEGLSSTQCFSIP